MKSAKAKHQQSTLLGHMSWVETLRRNQNAKRGPLRRVELVLYDNRLQPKESTFFFPSGIQHQSTDLRACVARAGESWKIRNIIVARLEEIQYRNS